MVAVAQLIPQNPEEKASVLAVLRAHPDLQDFIARASDNAKESFADVRITLDTMRYDDWGPPVRMLVHVTQPWDEFKAIRSEYVRWLTQDPAFDLDVILVMPMWSGPIESYR
ncbi:MAG: hypothetical protein H0V37_11565 [Chloroflexia bacterium]|nr:hypothetical protein [Chloroflexia bacterium]